MQVNSLDHSDALIQSNLRELREHIKDPKELKYFDELKTSIDNLNTYKELDAVNSNVFWRFINNNIGAYTYFIITDSLSRIKMNLTH